MLTENKNSISVKSASLLISLLSFIFISAEIMAATNNDPVGLPAISGIAEQEQVLTADVSAISDADDFAKGNKGKFLYQWLRSGVDIEKATDNTYTLVQSDVGSKIRVRVSYVDGGGTTEILVSAETAAVTNINDNPDGLPTISGTARQGQILTAGVTAISDADGLGAFDYQWLRNDGVISGATASTYTLVQADVASKISVRVRYIDGGGATETLISAQTTSVGNANDVPSGSPTISGTVKQGETLTAGTSDISDVDGLGTFSYQWLRNGAVISGATASAYVLVQADVATQISVRVSYVDGGDTNETLISAQTAIVANTNDSPAGLLTISGKTAEGKVLTAVTSGISDADGLGDFSYQWLRSDIVIGGATASSYMLVQADVSSNIRVQVTYVDGGGTSEFLLSAATETVTNANDVPAGLPVISGSLTQGSVLTAGTSAITDVDGLGVFHYQWLRDTKAIEGATASSYTLVQNDVGHTIMVTVSYTDGGGAAESVTSAATAVITNPNDLPTGAVTISGSLTQGSLLTAETSTIVDADGLGAFSYQWLRNDGLISGATSSAYTLVQADVANKISVRVSYTDGGGLLETVISAPTAVVNNVNDAPAGIPFISGSPIQGSVLTAETSGITDADGLGAFSYQWLRDGGEISGAIASSYTLEQADAGAFISVRVSYTDAGLADESVLSKTQGPVQNINDIGAVTVAGQATEGSSLEVDAITDADGSSSSNFIYQWLRDGVDIAGGTASSYTLTAADVGRKVSLRVIYTDDLGTDESVLSNAIGPVFTDLPRVSVPVSNPVNATGWFTFVDIGQAVAFDALDGPLTVSSDSNGQFRPGETIVTWSATDLAGNVGTATQIIKVVPLAEVSKDQRSAEGNSVEFKVILNGDALAYPVKVPYFVSGTADGNDHTLVPGNVWIDEPAAGELPEASIIFDIKQDADTAEGTETIIIALNIPINAVLGPLTTHAVEIVEGNIAPLVSLNASQLGIGNMLQVDPAGGEVTVSAIATDANGGDLVYDWSGTENALIDSDGDSKNSRFILDLQTTPVTPGFYSFHVSVSDGIDTIDSELMLSVLSVAPVLGTSDSDNDGINDEIEGFGDADGDGVADYLDAIQASNVLQQKILISDQFLIQTEPGLKLSLGETAFKASQGRSMVEQTEVTDYSFDGNTPVDEIANTGGYFDFTVSGLPVAGQSVQVVIPQLLPMPKLPVYRKLTMTGWQDFVSNSHNSIASAAGEEGYCPPPGHAAYQPGLHEGHWCLQLNIEDGGPNDIDGVANNTVTDPGGVGQFFTKVNVSSGGGGGSLNPLLPALSILIMLVFRKLLNTTGAFYNCRS